jgi:hypothetical protein
LPLRKLKEVNPPRLRRWLAASVEEAIRRSPTAMHLSRLRIRWLRVDVAVTTASAVDTYCLAMLPGMGDAGSARGPMGHA